MAKLFMELVSAVSGATAIERGLIIAVVIGVSILALQSLASQT